MTHYIMDSCIICGTCWEICPLNAVEEFEDYYRINESCDNCGKCLKPCPNFAITKTSGKGQKLEKLLNARATDNENIDIE